MTLPEDAACPGRIHNLMCEVRFTCRRYELLKATTATTAILWIQPWEIGAACPHRMEK